MSEAYIKESLRRSVERATAARKGAKGYQKEAKKRQAAAKMLVRWEVGCQVRDKRTGKQFEYRGNVNEADGVKYLLRINPYWDYIPLQFSMTPSKEIVRL